MGWLENSAVYPLYAQRPYLLTYGPDSGVGDKIFEGLAVVAFAWTLVLVVVGARTVSGLSWPRRR